MQRAIYLLSPRPNWIYPYKSPNSQKRRFCEKLEIEVVKNLSNPDFQIEDLCRTMMMSRTHLYRQIKQHFGSSFTDILTTTRIRRSSDLLLHSSKSISEICYECGFRDPSYFVRVFRKKTGLTPKAFRNNF